jgi:hypothetical protein
MTHPDTEMIPIPVRLHPDDLSAIAQAARKHRDHYDITFNTIRLSAQNPVLPVCNPDLSREGVYVQALTNDVVLCETKSKAQDPANSATANPNFPEGTLLPKANTKPVWLPVTDGLWATAGTFPAQLAVILVNRVR